MNDWKNTVSNNLKKWRGAYGWSQDVLAEKADCSKSVVRDLEAKQSGASVDMLGKLAVAMNIDIAQLFKEDGPPRDLSSIEIGEIAEGAPFNVLLDIVFKKVKSVPPDIIEMAYYFKPSEKAWEDVRGALDFDIKEQLKKEKEKKA